VYDSQHSPTRKKEVLKNYSHNGREREASNPWKERERRGYRYRQHPQKTLPLTQKRRSRGKSGSSAPAGTKRHGARRLRKHRLLLRESKGRIEEKREKGGCGNNVYDENRSG